MEKDYGSWTLKKLKEELRKRKAKTNGKKTVLVKRLTDYDTIFGGLVNDPEETYQIAVPDPGQFRDITSESTLPNMTEKDLQQYSELAERENLETSKNMYNELYLQTARVAYTGGEYFIMALCCSEMRKSVTYNVTIKAIDNLIIECQCECAAGMGPHGQCKHIMVLIYGLTDFTKTKQIKRSISCTSSLQTFHRPAIAFKGNPVKAEELNLKLRHTINIATFDPRPSNNTPEQKTKYQEYFINSTINFCTEQNIKMPLLQLRKPANKRALFHDHDYFEDTEEERYVKSLKLNSKHDLEKIEKQTKTHKKIWKSERKLRLQSSDFGRICKCTENNRTKLAKRLLKEEEINSPAIQHGKRNEKAAVQKFCQLTCLEVTDSGIIVHPDIQYLGCTPDGLVDDGGLLEVKCPYTARNTQVTAENVSYFYLCDQSGLYKLKEDHDYYYQVQGQLLCTNKEFVYFFVYTITDYCIVKINRDEQFIAEMKEKLNYFYNHHYKQALIEKYVYNEK